jgi:hypothetical protein
MMETDGDGVGSGEWIVVCVGCLRISRDRQWTDERAPDVEGKSSGFCDACVKLERERQANA